MYCKSGTLYLTLATALSLGTHAVKLSHVSLVLSNLTFVTEYTFFLCWESQADKC